MDIRKKLGDSPVNSGRINRIFAGHTRFTHFVQYLIAFCSRSEAASDVISGFVWGRQSPTAAYNFVMLVYTVLEKFDPKSKAAFSVVFRISLCADRK